MLFATLTAKLRWACLQRRTCRRRFFRQRPAPLTTRDKNEKNHHHRRCRPRPRRLLQRAGMAIRDRWRRWRRACGRPGRRGGRSGRRRPVGRSVPAAVTTGVTTTHIAITTTITEPKPRGACLLDAFSSATALARKDGRAPNCRDIRRPLCRSKKRLCICHGFGRTNLANRRIHSTTGYDLPA